MFLPKIILWTRPADERWRYNITSSLIGWAHSQNDLCFTSQFVFTNAMNQDIIITQVYNILQIYANLIADCQIKQEWMSEKSQNIR